MFVALRSGIPAGVNVTGNMLALLDHAAIMPGAAQFLRAHRAIQARSDNRDTQADVLLRSQPGPSRFAAL
jgi:hypothetical protein